MGDDNANKRRDPLVACPHCGGRNHFTKKFCGDCAQSMTAPVAPAEAKKEEVKTEPQETWDISVLSPTGGDGDYVVCVQATKNGEGQRVNLTVATRLTIFPDTNGVGNPVGGRFTLLSSDLVVGKWKKIISTKQPCTDENGVMHCIIRFTGKEERVIFGIAGTQASTAIKLKGPAYKEATTGGFREAFLSIVNFNRRR